MFMGCCVLLLWATVVSAQIDLSVTVLDGSASTTCSNFLGIERPQWDVAVAGEAWVTYPDNGFCNAPLPNDQYRTAYTCPTDLPATVEVCLRAFNNNAILPCDQDRECIFEVCQDFPVPAPGAEQDFNLTIGDNTTETQGSVTIRIQSSPLPYPDNDLLCNAVSLGTLTYGDTLGDLSQGLYSNACADNVDEINPQDSNEYLFNDAGTWIHFRTGSAPSGMFVARVNSDPENTGDPINLEMIGYTSSDGTCNGTLTRTPTWRYNTGGNDVEVRVYCPEPDTDYFFLIDGDGSNDPALQQGVYSFEVFDIGLQEAGDLRCDYVDLGVVPENGETETDQPYGNYCSGYSDDPFVQSFTSRTSVWFSFITPSSGHVEITAEGATDYPLDVQMAAYRSFTNDCTGFYTHLRSQYTNTDRDETFVLQCLDPGSRIFVLIDGSAQIDRGAFTARVRDLGDIRPVTQVDTTVCAGESVLVGSSIVHEVTGVYTDTLKYGNNCDSIVITNLTVLPELQLTVTQTQPALGVDGMDGVAVVTYSGGQGPYTLEWCDGTTADENTQLVADTECCVTLTDAFGCSRDTCFTVEFTTAIIPDFSSEAVACNGESTGAFSFSAVNGTPPYQFSWSSTDGGLNDSGTLTAAGEILRVESVPAGDYTVTLDDTFFDTTFVVTVTEPPVLVADLGDASDASCNGFADGTLSVSATGGTPPYQYAWDDGGATTPDRQDLAAGPYLVTVTDANDCTTTFEYSIGEPEPFLATAEVVREVSCFEGSDGSLTVTTNGNPTAWEWNTGATTAALNDLPTGTYSVLVTNEDGCQTEAEVLLPQPAAPLTATVTERSGISCFDSNDGRLGVQVSGPFQSLSYAWSDGTTGAERANLGPGLYTVTTQNERGCTASAEYTLEAPPAITATVSTRDITCLDTEFAGVVRLEDVDGGRGGFRYALDRGSFGPISEFTGLPAGGYTATVRDAAGCELTLDAIIQGPPEIFVDLGEDLVLPLGDSIALFATTNSDNAEFDWSHDPSLTDRIATVRPQASGVYRVMVYDTVTFCEAESTLFIEVDRRPRVYVPTAFSPNEDGRNDRFFIFGGNDVVQIRNFRIFARNGQEVFALAQSDPNDPNIGWDGRIRNQQAPIGVYVYSAEVEFYDGRREVISGDVVLVR